MAELWHRKLAVDDSEWLALNYHTLLANAYGRTGRLAHDLAGWKHTLLVTDDMKHLLLILALSAAVMLTGLGGSRLWDDDEPRNAGCAREMLARGDWIVPWFNNELRAHKPVLTYWCMMLSYLALGDSEFSARLPSALAAIGTTLLTYAMGRRLFSKGAALWSALILPTTLLFAMAGRIATPDSLLIFCVTLTMAIYVWVAWPEAPSGEAKYFPGQWWQAAAIYAAMGLAVLAKGPVGLVLPTAIIGLFLLLIRSASDRGAAEHPRWRFGLAWLARAIAHFAWTAWSMRPLTALAVVALIAGPWYLAVGYQTDWEFLREFFVTHNLRRTTGAMEGHSAGVWFSPVMLLVGFFPWSIFAFPIGLEVALARKRGGAQPASTLFLLCWIGVWLGAFTLAKTKLPSYATPCFPAVALLAGWFVDRLVRGEAAVGRLWPVASFACLTLVGGVAPIGLWLAARRYLPGDEWLAVLGAVPLAGGLFALSCWRGGQRVAAAGSLVATGAALVLGIFAVGAQVVDRHQQADRLLAAVDAAGGAPRVASYRVLEPSWVYYGRRPIRELANDPATAAAFLAANENAFLITTKERWERLATQQIPPEVEVLAEVPRFLKSDRLVLVGRPREGLARTARAKR